MNILEEFAHGNISPEPRYFKPNSAYGKAMETLIDNEEKLRETLTEAQKVLLENFTEAQIEINDLTSVDSFIYGYRLGVLMTTEVFDNKDNLIAGGEIGQ